jgi:molybdopterin molybdotransferase
MPALIDFDTAMAMLSEHDHSPLAVEQVPLAAAGGRILAEHISADRDLPPFNRSAMDGYAFRHGESTEAMVVSNEVRAGDDPRVIVAAGACVLISTGAAVPTDCDTVVPVEHTNRAGRGESMQITATVPGRGANIHPQAADAAMDDVVLTPRTRIGPAEIGIAAMVGCEQLAVHRRPTVAILTSGDEVVASGVQPGPQQIRNSNGPMVAALIERLGGHIVLQQHMLDTPQMVTNAIGEALETAEIIVTTGGISAGRHDHIPAVLESLGCGWLINGIDMQPGKPARVGHARGRTVVCLPGNPVSALVTGTVIVAPIVRAKLGLTPGPRWRMVRLAEDTRCNPNRTLLRPAMTPQADTAVIPTWQGSGDLVHAAGTRGIVRLPLARKAVAGTEVPFTRWP